ncbi:hypothetical protein G6F31_014640 [Rhizopus arrhizus]|nr:hypothetical protein G6F31_014640 [Rhizopus arrhizus]
MNPFTPAEGTNMSASLSQPIEEMTELRALQAQRNERLLGDRPPPKKDSAARADFEQNVAQDQDAIEQRRQRVLAWAEKASPDQIAALQAKIQEADKAVLAAATQRPAGGEPSHVDP